MNGRKVGDEANVSEQLVTTCVGAVDRQGMNNDYESGERRMIAERMDIVCPGYGLISQAQRRLVVQRLFEWPTASLGIRSHTKYVVTICRSSLTYREIQTQGQYSVMLTR